jgi:hypothetical protein
MQFRYLTLAFLCLLLVVAGCEQLHPEEEKTESGQTKEPDDDANSDDDPQDDEDDDTEDFDFHGYKSISAYFSHFGTKDRPIPMEDVLPGGCLYTYYLTMSEVIYVKSWIESAYIVGYTKGNMPESVVFSANGAVATNIVVAPSDTVVSGSRCMPVQLSKGTTYGDVRNALNLQENPDKLGHRVMLFGKLDRYYGTLGLKNVSDFELKD